MKKTMKRLELHLARFRAEADQVLNAYANEIQKRDDFLSNPDGRYSQAYLSEFSRNWKPEHDYLGILTDLRKEYLVKVNADLSAIRGRIDEILTQNPDPGYASKIQGYFMMGMADTLSGAEFEALERQAKNYSELKMLQQLASSRNKVQDVVKMENGKMVKERRNTKDPYYIQIPNFEDIYQDFKEFADFAKMVVEDYTGGYLPLSGNATADSFALSAQKYFDSGWGAHGKFLDELQPLIDLQPMKEGLNDRDREFLKVITGDDTFSSFVPERVTKLEKFPEIREMLAMDERYSKFLQEG